MCEITRISPKGSFSAPTPCGYSHIALISPDVRIFQQSPAKFSGQKTLQDLLSENAVRVSGVFYGECIRKVWTLLLGVSPKSPANEPGFFVLGEIPAQPPALHAA